MSFQNFYTLIFNLNIKPKLFIKLVFLAILLSLVVSVFFKYININMNSNDLIKNYQMNKMRKISLENIDTIIVGDSSAGNAINANLFERLSNQKTLNLSLTGSWGILGSLGIIKNVYLQNPNIKNIIIIHTLDIWNRPFSKNSMHELFSLKDRINTLGLKNVISNEINVKELKWFYEYILRKIKNKHFDVIDYRNDYLKQKEKQNFKKFYSLSNMSSGKLDELKMLDDFCSSKKLNCIFANGPIINEIIYKSDSFLRDYDSVMKKSKLIYIDHMFTYNAEKIGDSKDHVLPKYKNEITLEYYNVFKKYLNN